MLDKVLRRPGAASKATYRKRSLRKSCYDCAGHKPTPPFHSVCVSQLSDWYPREHETNPEQLLSIFSWYYHPSQKTLQVWGQRTASL
jgi:hypothetical protein